MSGVREEWVRLGVLKESSDCIIHATLARDGRIYAKRCNATGQVYGGLVALDNIAFDKDLEIDTKASCNTKTRNTKIKNHIKSRRKANVASDQRELPFCLK